MTIEIEKNEITIKIPQSETKNRKKGKVNYFKMKNRFHQKKIKIRKNRLINLKYLEQPL